MQVQGVHCLRLYGIDGRIESREWWQIRRFSIHCMKHYFKELCPSSVVHHCNFPESVPTYDFQTVGSNIFIATMPINDKFHTVVEQ